MRAMVLLSASAVSGFVLAADVSVGFREVGGIGVEADGSQTVDGKLTLSPEATFYKTGAGTLTVPSSSVDSPNGYSINVLKGKMVLSGAAAEASAPTAPAVVTEKAALWLDASTLTEGAAVSTWDDVRGAGYASAIAKQRISKVDQTEVDPPVVATTNGSRGVYFGGKSGKWMSFQQNGSTKTFSKTHHFFVVHSVYQTYGAVLGYTVGSRGHGLLTTADSNGVLTSPFDSNMHYLIAGRGDLDWCNFQGRFFLDGRLFDPRTSQISRGASLLEGDLQAMPETFDAIYRNYFETYSQETPGGDYVHEVLLFTCPLTEAERLDVERYLLNKWKLPQTEMLMSSKGPRQIAHPPRGTGLVKVAEGASVEVTAAADETTAPFQFDGEGEVVKKGAGTLKIGGGAARPFAGSFELEEGDLLVHGGAMPPVTVRAGEAWDAASWPATRAQTIAGDAASGIRVSKTATSALHASKTGAGELLVAGVEAGTGRINVEKGVLHFAAKECDAVKPDTDIGADEVEIPNHSFEMPFTIKDNARLYNWSSLNGWFNDSGDTSVQYVTSANPGYSAWSAYSLPDGTNALMIVLSGYGYTKITVPRAGEYEVSFFAASRYGSSRGASSGDFGKRSTVEVRFNDHCIGKVQVNQGAYTKFRYRFTVTSDEAGVEKKFGFKSLQSYSDNCMIIDDVHIRAVAEAARADAVKVPGGDFEDSAYYNPDGTAGSRFSSAFCRFMTSPDWDLTIAADAPNQNPTNGYVAICTAGTPTLYGVAYTDRFTPFYPQADGRCGSGVLGFIGSYGMATTKNTFKLPKGKWLLRAALMENGGAYHAAFGVGEKSFGTTPVKVEAKLTRNGQVSSLGTISTSSHLMQSCTWPTVVEVTADEGEEILLAVSQTVASGACLLDDLEFVPATAGDPERNLFPNADFERSVSFVTWAYPTTNTYSSSTGRFRYSTDSWAFGLDVVNGDFCMRLHNHAGIYETVDFPGAGLYRITVPAHPRPDGTSYAHKSLRASVVLNDGSELVIFDQPIPFNPAFQEVSYLFRMPETGSHQVRIVGVPYPVDNANYNTMIDNIRLTKVEEKGLRPPQVAEDTALAVKAGAKLGLDYEGTVTVRSLKLGDTSVHGTVKASDYPDYLTGMGQVEVKPIGLTLIVR